MLVCLSVTAVLWHAARHDVLHDLQAEFDFRVRESVDRIEQRMKVYAQVLRGAQGMLSASRSIDRESFRTYVDALHIQENYPGIQGIGISLIIPQSERPAHVAGVRRLGFPAYTVWPEGEREMITSVVQLEPFSDRNRRAFGYDMFSEPVRREAMERARDTGMPAITGKVTLVQEDGRDVQAGFLMYLAVYRNGITPDTLDARRAEVIGWTYMPFRMGDLMAKVGGERAADIGLEIFDGKEVAADMLMYDSDEVPMSLQSNTPLFKAIHPMALGGHTWTLAMYSMPRMEALNHGVLSVIVIVGILLSLLLTALTYLLAAGWVTALAFAARMTRDLKESEEVLTFAIDGAGDGVWDWNVQSGHVRFSERWKEMLGYSGTEIGDNVDEWKARVHPDDLPRAMSALEAYFSGESISYVCEHRMRCKDDSWKWILARGMVVSRTKDGLPLRMVGMHTDITSQRQAEERERMLKNIYSALSATNEAIIHVQDERVLFSKLCKIAVDYGGMPLAWVGIPDADGRLAPVASYGAARGYLEGLVVSVLPGLPEGEGPAGQAYRGQRSVVFNNVQRDEAIAPWRTKGEKYGLMAGASFPIARSGNSYALLLVYSCQIGAFNDEIVHLMERMAENIGFALDNMDSETIRRRKVEEIRALFENASDGIFIASRDGRYLEANERGVQLLGYAKEEITELHIADVVAERERSRVPLEMASWRDTSLVSEWTFKRKDGSEFFGEVNSQLLPDGRVIGIVRDITERRRSEEELKLAALVFTNASEAMTVTDADANIVAVNPAFTHLTGYEADEAIGKNPRILKSGRQDEAFYRQMWDALITEGKWQGEIWNRRKNGQIYPERLSINTIYGDDGSVHRYVAMFQDITQEKQSEETIRALSANHIEVREQEGKRIAREIHDDLGQRLTLLRMDVLMLPKVLGEQTPGLSEAVIRMRTAIDDCIRIARNIVSDLRPAVLDIGIVPAMEWLLDDFEKRTGIECLLHNLIDVDLLLDEQQAIGVFRILQESLTNVAKHANATQVEVDLEIDDGKICITIADNGAGFDTMPAGRADAYGLIGMRERAAILGGSFDISGRRGKGVTLKVCIPLASADSPVL